MSFDNGAEKRRLNCLFLLHFFSIERAIELVIDIMRRGDKASIHDIIAGQIVFKVDEHVRANKYRFVAHHSPPSPHLC